MVESSSQLSKESLTGGSVVRRRKSDSIIALPDGEQMVSNFRRSLALVTLVTLVTRLALVALVALLTLVTRQALVTLVTLVTLLTLLTRPCRDSMLPGHPTFSAFFRRTSRGEKTRTIGNFCKKGKRVAP